MLDALLLCRYEKMLRPEQLRWQTWIDDQWDRAWHGLQRFEAHPDVLTRPLDIVQIGIVCVVGYLDFRFPDSGWRKAFPKIAEFNEKMMQRDSVKISVPPT
jgi:glutathione S-transferase